MLPFQHFSSIAHQLSVSEKNCLINWLCSSKVHVSCAGSYWTHPPGSHGLWLTCGHMSPTPLHNEHEQQKVCHINFTLMGKWPGAAKCTHSPDMEVALLWSQCDWSLLLWDACCTAAGMCWYISDQADHSSGMSLHPVDAYYFHCLLLREHFGSNFEDKLCRGKRKGLFHLPLTFDRCSSVLWKCHLHVHETKLFSFPSEG